MPNFCYQSHDSFTTPSHDTIVYHSIHLDYLKESIKNEQLRFASVLSYKDPFEGRFSYCDEFSIGGHLISTEDFIFGPAEMLVKAKCENFNDVLTGKLPIPKNIYPLKYFFDEWSNYVFSHCWSLNSTPWNENYGESIITIQSTIGNIKKAFAGDYCYYIGKVKYINYLTGQMPSFAKLLVGEKLSADILYERHLHKRLKYKKEEEVRLRISWESFSQKHPEVEQILPHNPYDQDTEPGKLYEKDYLVVCHN